MQIQKENLFGKTLKVSPIRNKSNLDNIFKSYLDYFDLESLCNSPNYFERLPKNFICNDWANRSFNILCHFYIY